MLLGMIAFAAQLGSSPMPAFLAGGWTTGSPEGAWVEEWWTPPRAGVMMGAGRSGKGASLDWWEHTRIELVDGQLRFCALPKGQAGACFNATKATPTEIVFEKPGHDYPTRIAYRRDGEALIAEISGKEGSKTQRWRFRRAD